MPSPNEALFAGKLKVREGKYAQAIPLLFAAMRHDPGNWEVHSALAVAQYALGRTEIAIDHARTMVRLGPQVAAARLQLAELLSNTARCDEAAEQIRAAMGLAPPDGATYTLLVLTLNRALRLIEAVDVAHEGLEKLAPNSPGYDGLLHECARAELALGRAGQAVDLLRRGVALFPEEANLARLLAFSSNYDQRASPEAILEAHRNAGRLVEASVPWPQPPPARPVRSPIRVGFLSPDLRDHSVARFLEPILRHAPRDRLHLTCYWIYSFEDATTRRLRELSDAWRELRLTTAPAVAAKIRDDRIDVLIELAAYTSESALDVLAHQPAPVQCTYIGYPNTTGMSRVQVRLVDSLTDPRDPDHDRLATERLVRIDPCFLCFQPVREAPDVSDLPALRGRGVTFGCLNSYMKISDALLACWARILQSVPSSRLLLKNQSLQFENARTELSRRMRGFGIDEDRVELKPPTPGVVDHLRAYHEIDIALDTFPYVGTTTTCEALLMGVPVVSLAGRTHVTRVGLSLLSAIGEASWCGHTEAEYVSIAVGLASNVPALAETRSGLRAKMLASALCDGARFGEKFAATIQSLVTTSP